MSDASGKDFSIGVIAGLIVMVIIDLAIPWGGPIIGGFVAGYLAKGEVTNRAKAGVLAAIFAAIFATIATYARLVTTAGPGYIAPMGTGAFLYLVIVLYFVSLAFLGSILTVAVRK